MSRFGEFENSEVFDNLVDIMEKNKLMDKQADYVYPEELFFSKEPDEIDVDVTKLASDGRSGIYDLSGYEGNDKMVERAHPGGGTNVVDAPNELGKAETILEQGKKHEDMAKQEATGKLASLINELAKLADKLQDNGLGKQAHEVDRMMEKLALEIEMKPVKLPELDMAEDPEEVPTLGDLANEDKEQKADDKPKVELPDLKPAENPNPEDLPTPYEAGKSKAPWEQDAKDEQCAHDALDGNLSPRWPEAEADRALKDLKETFKDEDDLSDLKDELSKVEPNKQDPNLAPR